MKKLFPLLVFLSIVFASRAQTATGEIKGRITDKRTAHAIRSATVSVFNSYDVANRKTQTDADGNYKIDSLAPGIYNIMIVRAGYTSKIITGVVIHSDQSTMVVSRLRKK
jgi:hypothetical protein